MITGKHKGGAMTTENPLIIGTRGSRLARWQAEETARQLGVPARLNIIRTSGDRFRNIPLQNTSQTGFFTREIEQSLLNHSSDLAVHSLKDLPTDSPDGLVLGAFMKRGPVSDLLIIHPQWHDPSNPFPLKPGCRTGAGSLRRQALLKHFKPISCLLV